MEDQIPAPPDSAAELGKQIEKFTAVVEKIAKDLVANVQRIERFSRRTRRITKVLTVSVTLDVLLTVAGLFLYHRLDQSHHRQDQANQRIAQVVAQLRQVQDATSNDALCPLYGLIVTGYHPELRPAGTQREQYTTDYKVLLRGYEALGCRPILPDPFATPKPTGK